MTRKAARIQTGRVTVFDVVVLGAGPAGLAAAIAAAEEGMRTAVIERAPALSDLPAARFHEADLNLFSPRHMQQIAVADSPSRFLADALRFGEGRADPRLLEPLCYESPALLEWLRRFDIVFESRPRMLPGAPWPRACRVIKGEQKRGESSTHPLLTKLFAAAEAAGVRFFWGAEVNAIEISEPDSAFGAREFMLMNSTGTPMLRARTVVVAGGGFAGDTRLVAAADRRLMRWMHDDTEGRPAALRLLQALGAASAGLSFFDFDAAGPQVAVAEALLRMPHLAAIAAPAAFSSASLRFIGKASEPLVQKLDRAARLPKPPFLVFNGAALPEIAGRLSAELRVQFSELVALVPAAEAARRLGTSLQALESAFTRQFPTATSGTLQRVGLIELVLRPAASLGGVLVHADAAVLDRRGRSVPGLFAAGDVVGGLHGRHAVPGSRLAAALIYGRLAGRSAALAVKVPDRTLESVSD